MDTEQQGQANTIQVGMKVASPHGDLGVKDMSEPIVAKVVRDQQNNVETVVIKKGLVFKRELSVPANRVQEVAEHGQHEKTATVSIDVGEAEIEEKAADLLELVEESIPTAEGLRVL